MGLEGSFGRVLLGKHDSAYKTMTIGLGTNILADTSADTCNSQAIFCRGDQRVSNTVQYYSPVVANGFSAGVSTVLTKPALPWAATALTPTRCPSAAST